MKNIETMTLKEKIGQLVFVGFQGLSYNDNLKTLIHEYKVGNIILFTRNIASLEQLHNLNQTLYYEILNENNIIPFISIDQEGGMVTRIMKEATFLPGNMTVGATNPINAYKIGKIAGEELRALGINMNLAPSLDVNNNPINPVIGVRSYADNPQRVSEFGINYIKGLQEKGIIATAKHFPGHGDTSSDSHYSLPIIPHDKKRLEKIELYPFKEAIKAGVDAIMSAHVFFTAYEDEQLPATLSKKVMTDLLRTELGFEGLIVSDCMEMKAIDDNYTTSVGSLMGLLAGLDMVFVSATYSKQIETLELIETAVLDGRFPISLLDEKVERILKYKNKIFDTINAHFFKKTFVEKYQLLTAPESKEFASRLVDMSLTKVRGKDFYPNKKILVIAPEPFATTIAEDEVSTRSIIDAIKQAQLDFDTIKIKVNIDDEDIEKIVNKAKYYPQVVICTYNAIIFKNQAKMVNDLSRNVEDLFVISTRNPYDLLAFKQVENYFCVYEYTPNSVKTITRFLEHKLLCSGKLPVKLEEKIKIGASVYVGLEQSLTENLNYLSLLKSLKIDLVFISAHMPEMRPGFEQDLSTIIDYANANGLKVILDVSKPMMKSFNIPSIYALRLDYGFSNDEIVDLYYQNKFVIELNASTVKEEDLKYLLSRGVDLNRVRVSHNFYPKPYTGLSQEIVALKNMFLKKYGLNVMAYIPSQNQKRGPIYEGLPTVEAHRNMPLEAVLSEMKLLGMDEIFFGDSNASQEELELAVNFDFETIHVPLHVTSSLTAIEKSQLQKVHVNRLDQGPFFVRSSSRVKTKIEPKNCIKRVKHSVTIDNCNFTRYQGEVSILLDDLGEDHRCNVVGYVKASNYLLKGIKPGAKFKFVFEE